MSQNYFGESIYNYDMFRNKDFYNNLYQDPDFSFLGEIDDVYGNRYGSSLIQFKDKLYIIGGCSLYNCNTLATLRDMKNDIFEYNTELNTCTEVQVESLIDLDQFLQQERFEMLQTSTLIPETTNIVVTDKVNFPKICSSQVLEYGEYIYLIGGMASEDFTEHGITRKNPYANYILRTKDMLNWERVKTNYIGIGNLAQHRCCICNGYVYLIYENSVYRSQNCINWTNILSTRHEENLVGQFPVRYDFGLAVVGEYMYVFGGTDTDKALNDVWYSNNGLYWNKKTYVDDDDNVTDAPWEPRFAFGCIMSQVYNTVMIIGGKTPNIAEGGGYPYTLSDVWTTTDFDTWVKADITISPRSDCGVASFNKSIYIVGGCYNTLLEYASDTWAVDCYNDIYEISPPGQYLVIEAIAGTFVVGKLKAGRTVILESSYNLYDPYILEPYKYKNGTNPNSIVHKV